ncbi:hypothetical protein BBJ29_003949 [Phytophthora kernoviae]|uniref:Uncharacterized protein n=1 Tax=Phytophthora kernoviae TaxID=325452 RepID=A0A3F2RKG9_9STRA|nr:hypothetical protein BBP00_00006628 [Phytophthora kernoviae]RLN63418.1 hypothetical protein BBJ29_003949 [Phytophthora kernoviae]
MDKSELVAFEREKRLYKDAYVENFRSVRYFPSLATIGAGRVDGDSIVLVQETQLEEQSSPQPRSHKYEDVASRAIPPDSLEAIFNTTMPLTSFRTAIMCKHSKARRERQVAPSSEVPTFANNQATQPYGISSQPGVFKPTSSMEAKGSIQRKVAYDGQPFEDKPRSLRSVTLRADAPRWANNSPTSARRDISNKVYFNAPLEGPIKADRKYTQEFIRLNMEASHAGRRHAECRERHPS